MPGLTDHRQRRLDLADMLRALLHIAHGYADQDREREVRDLLSRLAAGRFRLAVAGQFSRGKTTLMNALLGETFLPTGALPVTSVVTTVRYGTRARALIRSRAGGLPVEVPVAEAARFIAQASADRARMKVASVEIEIPAELLRLGFEFIDTPGVGSAIAANTAATMSLLPRVDAIVFVTGFDSAMTQAEAEFLITAAARAGQVFVVINKRDLVSAPDAAAVLSYVQDWARDQLPGATPRVYGLSALTALRAAISDDDQLLADSGVEPFRAGLTQFLTAGQGAAALRSMAAAAAVLVRGQVRDLRAGPRAEDGPAAVTAAFDEQVRNCQARLAAAATDLDERLSAALPRLLDECRPAWEAALRSLLAGEASGTSDPQAAAGGRPPGAGWPGEAARQAVAGWLEPAVAELQDTLTASLAGQITALRRAAWSPRELTAVGGPASRPAAPDPPAWTVPELLIPEIRWEIPDQGAGRPHRRGRRAAAGRDDAAALAAGLAGQARAGLQNVAARWAAQLREQAERDLTGAASQARRYLTSPPRPGDLATLAGLEFRLARFQAALDHEALDPAAPPPSTGQPGDAPAGRPDGRPAAHPAGPARCEICTQLESELTDFLASTQLLLATSEAGQARHARAGGFCALHTWRMAGMSSPVGLSAGYAQLARSVAVQLESALRGGAPAAGLAGELSRLAAAPGCSACAALARREAQAAAIAAARPAASGTPALALCLRHLAAVLQAGPGQGSGRAMIRALAAALRRAAEDMRSYALKREALQHSLVTDDEARAYSDAIRLLAGASALAEPWSEPP